MSKVGFSNYVIERYTGFANRATVRRNRRRRLPRHHQQAVRRERRRTAHRHAERRRPDRIARPRRRCRPTSRISRRRSAAGIAGERIHRRRDARADAVQFPEPLLSDRRGLSRSRRQRRSGRNTSAIVDAGFNLQLDAPDLAMRAHCFTGDKGPADMKRYVPMAIEAMNAAIKGLPRDKVRLHLCWGNYAGPHHHDIELKDIIAPVLKTQRRIHLSGSRQSASRARMGGLGERQDSGRHRPHSRRDRHADQSRRAPAPRRAASRDASPVSSARKT